MAAPTRRSLYAIVAIREDMTFSKSFDDLAHSIAILDSNIKLFHSGTDSTYRVVATQLRMLLCDGKNSLVPRLVKNPNLNPLCGYISDDENNAYVSEFGVSLRDTTVFQLPGWIQFRGDGSVAIDQLFDGARAPIPLEEWLDQPLFTLQITIRELIRSVADKEGVHSDKDYNDTLKFTKSMRMSQEELHPRFIIAIGEYILLVLKTSVERHRQRPPAGSQEFGDNGI